MSKDELKRIVLELLNDEDVIAALYAPLTGAADAGREYSSGPDAIVSGVRNEPQKIHLTLNADGIFDLLNDDAKGGDDEGES